MIFHVIYSLGISLGYTISSKVTLAGVVISKGADLEFFCHYKRLVSAGGEVDVDMANSDDYNAIGHLKYQLTVEDVGSGPGGDVKISIKPLHKISYIHAK